MHALAHTAPPTAPAAMEEVIDIERMYASFDDNSRKSKCPRSVRHKLMVEDIGMSDAIMIILQGDHGIDLARSCSTMVASDETESASGCGALSGQDSKSDSITFDTDVAVESMA